VKYTLLYLTTEVILQCTTHKTSGKCMTNVNIASAVNFSIVTMKLLFLHQCFKYFITWLYFHTLLLILMMPCKI